MLAPRDGAGERLLRDGAELRSRPLLERTVRSRGIDTDERFLSDLSDRLVRPEAERPDDRLLDRPDERSVLRDRLLVEPEDLELLRSDSAVRLARLADDRVESDARLLLESLRAGARPVTERSRPLLSVARSERRPARRSSVLPRDAARDPLRF